MKRSLIPLIAPALLALLGLTSCVSTMDPGAGFAPATYSSRPSYGYGSYGGGYGYSDYGYSSRRTCSVCGHYPCCCSSHSSHSYRSSRSSHDHDDHDDHKKKPADGHGRIRLLSGSDGDHRNRPQGSHSREWYEKRGYNLKEYKYTDEAGHVHKKKK